MGKHLKISCVVLLIGFLFNHCNTYIWQPVEKQLIDGTWIKSPQITDDDGVITGYEEWTFTKDGLLYRVFVQLTSPVIRDTIVTCSPEKLDFHTYEVENKVTRHFILTPNIEYWCGTSDEPKWLIVKLTKSEMYLTSIDVNKTKGAFQFGFTKI